MAVVKKPATAPKPIVQTHLDIKLLGTVVAGERSAAIMTVGTSAETTFFLGDPLYGRVVLKKIEVDAVILSDQGVDERVSLSKGKAMVGARVINPPTMYKGAAASPVMQTPQNLPPGMITDQGFSADMPMNQRLPPGIMNQGIPPTNRWHSSMIAP